MNFSNVEAVSFSNYLRISPLKLRRILDQIRYRSYDDSVVILKFLPNRACSFILKSLNSAVFNLRSKYKVDSSSIFVKEAVINVGPIVKRFRPRAQGRAFSIKKRMSHIIILL
jgi:large subunit ribosomal protein L22